MRFEELDIPGVWLIEPARHGDQRGFFSEVYNHSALCRAGIPAEFVQDNHSMSAKPGTIRGLHFQSPPHAQNKLVRVLRGRILDVVVDIRRGSPTYGRHVAVELSADNWQQLFVPIGCAHGFCTLEPKTEVFYKVSSGYAPDHDGGILWSDPALGIKWPVSASDATVSAKDSLLPKLGEISSPFSFAAA